MFCPYGASEHARESMRKKNRALSQRLMNIKSSIDNSEPYSRYTVAGEAKRTSRDRNARVKMENMKLFTRLRKITTRKEKREQFPWRPSLTKANQKNRLKKLSKIDRENHFLYKRLVSIKGCVDHGLNTNKPDRIYPCQMRALVREQQGFPNLVITARSAPKSARLAPKTSRTSRTARGVPKTARFAPKTSRGAPKTARIGPATARFAPKTSRRHNSTSSSIRTRPKTSRTARSRPKTSRQQPKSKDIRGTVLYQENIRVGSFLMEIRAIEEKMLSRHIMHILCVDSKNKRRVFGKIEIPFKLLARRFDNVKCGKGHKSSMMHYANRLQLVYRLLTYLDIETDPSNGMRVYLKNSFMEEVHDIGRNPQEWTSEETKALLTGVRRHDTDWNAILGDTSLVFHPSRMPDDLKMRWKTLYRLYNKQQRQDKTAETDKGRMTSRSKTGRREQRENSKNDNELTKIEANAADSKKEAVDEALEASLLHSLNLSTAQEEVESGSASQSQMHSAREGKAAVQNNKLESPTGAQLARMENHELPDDMELINKERHGRAAANGNKKKKETKKGHHHFSEGTNAEKDHHDELQPPAVNDVNKRGEEHESDWDNYEYDSDDQNHHGVLASASSPSNSATVSASAASELSVIVTKVDVIQKPEKKTVDSTDNSTKLAKTNRRPIVANGKPLLQTAASEYTVDSKDLDHSVAISLQDENSLMLSGSEDDSKSPTLSNVLKESYSQLD